VKLKRLKESMIEYNLKGQAGIKGLRKIDKGVTELLGFEKIKCKRG